MYGTVGDITLDSLRESTARHRAVPVGVDQGYVLDAYFDDRDEDSCKFCIVWSTIRMSTSDIGDVIYCDCTYKCVWNGYPITMIGFSDKNRKFHPIILAVSTNETHVEFTFIMQSWHHVNASLAPKFLMADASEAAFNAARTIWPNIVRLMCYAHVFMVCTKTVCYTFSCVVLNVRYTSVCRIFHFYFLFF